MMPPVSLPLNGGTGRMSARAGRLASIPETTRLATRPAAAMIRMSVTPIGLSPVYGAADTVKRTHGPRIRSYVQLVAKCCRAALDLPRPSRHGPGLADHALWIAH